MATGRGALAVGHVYRKSRFHARASAWYIVAPSTGRCNTLACGRMPAASPRRMTVIILQRRESMRFEHPPLRPNQATAAELQHSSLAALGGIRPMSRRRCAAPVCLARSAAGKTLMRLSPLGARMAKCRLRAHFSSARRYFRKSVMPA